MLYVRGNHAWWKWQTCLVYLDYVVVLSTTFAEHLQRLRVVLQAVRSASLSLKPQKCHFGFTELKFLGRLVSADGSGLTLTKLLQLRTFRPPLIKNCAKISGTLLLLPRRIENFAKLASPLAQLARDDESFLWGNEQQASFEDRQRLLQSPLVLAHFNEDSATEIYTDASNVGLGAVLAQHQNGAEKVIAYVAERFHAPNLTTPQPRRNA